MHPSYSALYIALLSAASATKISAPVVTNAPNSPYYVAQFQQPAPVVGNITFSASPFGNVDVKVSLSSLPTTGGPFKYHIHNLQVPTGQPSNCAATGAHLDPYNVTEDPPCNPHDPSNCQLGDLSGKFGALTSTAQPSYNNETAEACPQNVEHHSYVDRYLRLANGADGIAGRSVVFHDKDGKRIACATIVEVHVPSQEELESLQYDGHMPTLAIDYSTQDAGPTGPVYSTPNTYAGATPVSSLQSQNLADAVPGSSPAPAYNTHGPTYYSPVPGEAIQTAPATADAVGGGAPSSIVLMTGTGGWVMPTATGNVLFQGAAASGPLGQGLGLQLWGISGVASVLLAVGAGLIL